METFANDCDKTSVWFYQLELNEITFYEHCYKIIE